LAGQRLDSAKTFDEMGYPVGYFESTAGSFKNEPLEGPADSAPVIRESW